MLLKIHLTPEDDFDRRLIFFEDLTTCFSFFFLFEKNLYDQLYLDTLDTLIYFHIIDIMAQDDELNENELVFPHDGTSPQ